MTTTAPRAPIDIDAIEREMRQPQHAPAPTNRTDPLAELARIVGQDDPFRSLLQGHQEHGAGARPGAARRTEPTFYDDQADRPANEAHPSMSPADAFDQYLATVEQGAYAHERDAGAQNAGSFGGEEGDPFPHEARRPSRHRFVQVGAGLGVLALCVTGALGWKSLSRTSNGGPVTVLADKSPLKEAPPVADGVEIPDQNKQIYDRNASEGSIKVVNREEQPVDVGQAVRSVSRDTAGQGGATPGSTAMLIDSLGEPRRVRTVSVKPDTPPPAMQQQREAKADSSPSPRVSPIPTMVMPEASSSASTSVTQRPSRTLPTTRSLAADSNQAAAQNSGATPESEAPRPRPQRVASVAPETTASTGEPMASIGGFSVQLGVRNSEADARAAFRQMQGKYSQLAGKPELIRQAEVNGSSIYRVRVGPLGKNEANTLCTQLKGAGGQCFVAKN